ncbi:MAG: alpha-mannosidase [Cyanobacteria bacterium P01_D01_bin.36]
MAATATTSPLPTTVQTALTRLRQLNTQNIQAQWRLHPQDIEIANLSITEPNNWPTTTLNDREHIAWEKGLNVLWLHQAIAVPNTSHGYPLAGLTLRLALTWWAEDAQIYVNGYLVQSGDLFECFTRICLSENVTPGQIFQVAIRLVSPGHDDGALVRSQLIYELPPSNPTPEPSFVADELEVLATLEPSTQNAIETGLEDLDWASLSSEQTTNDAAADALNLWQNLSTPSPTSTQPIPASIHPFQQSLSQLRRTLKPFSKAIKARKIQCVGHAHLDMAWLWPIADTWEAAERTFKSILSLQEDFPALTYTHSSPALFDWLENNRPELFKQIQQKVAQGSWTIDAGLWIEPEFNIIGGEAIARQILYGQRYCQEKFGHISTVAWLPDSFGFCWQLPQLLTQGGIETFATLKLSWNDTTEFSHQLFWWQSPDGSRILSLMLPPIGTDINPIKMATYAKKWETSTGIPDTLWLPGLGDHGGGPTRDMLEKSQRWQNSPFFPELSFTTPQKYINNLIPSNPTNAANTPTPLHPHAPTRLPTHNSDLYLELHRGCYTTHADQKQNNRHCEDLLYQAEVFATIAQIFANQPYPQDNIDTAWKKLLFNQFHDILPGTSIPEVFVDANRDWKKVKEIGNRILEESLSAIAQQIELSSPPQRDAQPIIIFNSLSWPQTKVITLSTSDLSTTPSQNWSVFSKSQTDVPCQLNNSKIQAPTLSILVEDLPAVGYQVLWVCPSAQPIQTTTFKHYILENQFLKATIAPNTGTITSLIEKITHQEIFSQPGNQLQVFQDKGQYWDAWNIAPDYIDHPLLTPTVQAIEWTETGPITQRLRVTYRINQSTIHQTYRLDATSPYLEVENEIDWQETQVLLKAHFPLNVTADIATYEIPFGAIARTTHPSTAAEKAQWEVPALRWADLTQTDASFGTSILTQGKHGFDAGPHHLRLTLLKSPIWPDPNSDQGTHHFSYAIYPHLGTWQSAKTVHHARALNIQPTKHFIQSPTRSKTQAKSLSESQGFLHIQNENLILSALKPSANNPQEFILRYYEAHGQTALLQTGGQLNVTNITASNILETEGSASDTEKIKPWQIQTQRFKLTEKN